MSSSLCYSVLCRSMISPSKPSGFTLVELLVVMTIIVTATGLAGGLVVNGVAKFQTKAELQELEQIFIRASTKAFIAEKRLSIELSDRRVRIYSDESLAMESTFDHVLFNSLSIKVNKLGLMNKNSVEVLVNGNYKKINLDDVYNNAVAF